MARYYVNPDPRGNPSLTEGSVVFAIRDYEAEGLPERQRYPRALSDAEFCSYVEYLFITCGRHDNFKTHPEYKKGIEIRCQNRDEAEHLDRLMWERNKTVVKYHMTYYG